MSNLVTNEKQLLEKLLQMGSGYVLNFSDRTMSEFFSDNLSVEIYADRFDYGSGSKANRMRGFWKVADDKLVARSINELIDYIENQILLENLREEEFPTKLIEKGREIARRLSGYTEAVESQPLTEQQFVAQHFENLSLADLKLDIRVQRVIEQRLKEIEACLTAGAPLSVVFLCGSTLEGILLGIASQYPAVFNQATAAPKKDGKVLPFKTWTLANLIDVAHELSIIGEDVKKYSHALRDFRNYIHPFEQLRSGFEPHDHTARISWQVLKAAAFEVGNYQSTKNNSLG